MQIKHFTTYKSKEIALKYTKMTVQKDVKFQKRVKYLTPGWNQK